MGAKRPASRGPRAAAMLVALALAPLVTTSCRNDCEELAAKICECRNANQFDTNQCITRYVDRNPVNVTEAEIEACSTLVEGCDCTDLLEGRQSECGLAQQYLDSALDVADE